MDNLSSTYGALLMSALFATGLSGMVTVQTVLYFKLYPSDITNVKALVLLTWGFDLTHSGLICASMWDYLIGHFGDALYIDQIPRTISMSIMFTGILTLGVHCFFAHRIYQLSHKNVFMTLPVILLAVLRLASACGTTSQMIRLHSFAAFKENFRWLFTLGLALSTAVDILVTFSMFYLLWKNRAQSSPRLDHILDLLILYTFEVGSLTCAATVVSMICWLSMDNNLIFLALHFIIGKLYANSLLATLNARHALRRHHGPSQPMLELNTVNSLFRDTGIPSGETAFRETLHDAHHIRIDLEKNNDDSSSRDVR